MVYTYPSCGAKFSHENPAPATINAPPFALVVLKRVVPAGTFQVPGEFTSSISGALRSKAPFRLNVSRMFVIVWPGDELQQLAVKAAARRSFAVAQKILDRRIMWNLWLKDAFKMFDHHIPIGSPVNPKNL
jgi:hypothetical protein